MEMNAKNSFFANLLFVAVLAAGVLGQVPLLVYLSVGFIWFLLAIYVNAVHSQQGIARDRPTTEFFERLIDLAVLLLLLHERWIATSAAYMIATVLIETTYKGSSVRRFTYWVLEKVFPKREPTLLSWLFGPWNAPSQADIDFVHLIRTTIHRQLSLEQRQLEDVAHEPWFAGYFFGAAMHIPESVTSPR
jgi:hypothetical protein